MAALWNRAGHCIFVLWFLLFFSFLYVFSLPNLRGHRLDVYHTWYDRHTTWCGRCANLECRSEMCCTWLAENSGRKNYAKNRHLRTIAQICQPISLQLRHISTVRKKLVKWQYLLDMSSQYPELWPIDGWDPLASLGHRRKFLGLVTVLTLLNGRQPNFARCLAISCAGILYIHFGAVAPPPTEFCQVQNLLCIQMFRSLILAALLHGTRALGVSQSLWPSAEGATYIWQGGHHVGHRPIF